MTKRNGPEASTAHAWVATDYSSKPAQSAIANAHPERLLRALKNSSVGFSFSGGGFLIPYYLGSIRALSALGLLLPGTHVGGSSAGSLVAAIICCGLSVDTAVASVRDMMADCRQNGVYKRLGPGLRTQLESLLPHNAHTLCSGTAHIAITKVKPYGGLHSKRVSSFSSREDLIEALMASCHLPLLSNGSLTTQYRGRTVIDGGLTDLMPVPHQPEHVVKITCLPLDSIKRMPMKNKAVAQQHISLSPCRFRAWPYSHSETFKYAVSPGPDTFVDFLLEAGQQDVMSWAEAAGLPLNAPATALKPTDHEHGVVVAAACAAGMPETPRVVSDAPGQAPGQDAAAEAVEAIEQAMVAIDAATEGVHEAPAAKAE